jgi:hypothetical protein
MKGFAGGEGRGWRSVVKEIYIYGDGMYWLQ